ncbi:MAG: lysozyme inhibitor LprI family protein [Pseudomonadota bacterium]
MRLFLLAACIVPAAAAAQNLPFSPAETESCLLGVEGNARLDCVGKSAQACIDTPDGYTTAGMSFCLGFERDYWDARLNAAYWPLMALEEQSDAELTELGSAAPKSAPALRDMQRAWIAFRDSACFYEVTQWGGGTGAGPASANCEMIQTARQALALEDRLAQRTAQ